MVYHSDNNEKKCTMSHPPRPYTLNRFLIEALFEMPETRGKMLLDFFATAILGAAMFMGELPGEWAVTGIVAINAGLSAYLSVAYRVAKEAEERQARINDYDDQ